MTSSFNAQPDAGVPDKCVHFLSQRQAAPIEPIVSEKNHHRDGDIAIVQHQRPLTQAQ